jgi:predicted transcriptional regulator of viral defense system
VATDRRDLRRGLFRLATEQAGFFSAAQARQLGYSYQAQAHHTNAGNWIRIDRGIFRIPDWPSAPHDELVRWSLWSRGEAVISHESALAVHGIGELESRRTHLTVPPGFRRRDPEVTVHHATLTAAEVEDRGGFRVTSVARSVVDAIATSAGDNDQLERVVEDALAAGRISRRTLRSVAETTDLRAALRLERLLARES